MSGLGPPPGWNPPASVAEASLPPPPAFKLQKKDEDGAPSGARISIPDNEGHSKRKRRKPPKRRLQNPTKLRNIIEKHRNMGSSDANADKRAYLGALKYLPHAVYKLLENIPHPWESEKLVEVLYHRTGAITFVDEVPKVDPAEFMAKWGQMWDQMRAEKSDRTSFRRMKQPTFDDEEPIVTWKEIASSSSHNVDPIPLEHSPSQSIFELRKQAKPFLISTTPPTGFDFPSFLTAKSLHTQVPNGPRFEHQDDDLLAEPGSSSDPQRIIVRPRQFPVRVESQVAFPNLYGASLSEVPVPPCSGLVNAEIERHDNNKAYFVDSTINSAPSSQSFTENSRSLDRMTPFLSNATIDEAKLAQSLACYKSIYPFNGDRRKLTRAQDIALLKPLYTNRRPRRVMAPKTRRSYQRLLKETTKMRIKKSKSHHSDAKTAVNVIKLLANTKYFERTSIDWLEAALQLCQQGYQILQLLIHKRGLHFMHLDYNFNLKPTKTLTTKERKRSRFGNSFHLTRELLKMMKLVVDSHVQFRMGNIDAFELADGLQYIFTHLGQLTGIYRYKYRVMHQITACSDVKHALYDRFNRDGVGKGPGCGVWQPTWRIWLAFLRGNISMLERWLGNLINRQFFGRVSKGVAKTVTKQRIDSHYDLELRAAVLQDVLDVMPEQLRTSKTKVVMQHLSEAWRCWKANISWEVPGMPQPIKDIINRYIESKAEHWTSVTHFNRERIRAGGTVDKAVARKNLGRLTRLWLRHEQQRQSDFADKGPFLLPSHAVVMYKTMASYINAIQFGEPIKIPDASGYSRDTKLLTLALENIRAEYNMTARLTNTQREELALIEKAYDNPFEILGQIKRSLTSQRVFKNIEVSLLDFHSHLCPVYHVDPFEKIVDAYLDQFLWHEAEQRNLFPVWVKPSDDEVAPVMIHKFCGQINDVTDFWKIENGETSAILHLKMSRFVENADFTLLNQLLRLVLDGNIADYITAKMNASLSYKDMSHIQQVGIIRGFQFSSFVVQYYLLMVDLLLIGLPRALEFSKDPFNTKTTALSHPLKAYLRNVDDVYLVARLKKSEVGDLLDDYALKLQSDAILPKYPTKTCWPKDRTMRLIKSDVYLGRALYEEYRTRVPEVLGKILCEDASVFSTNNHVLHFEMAGFEVMLAPRDISVENDQDMGSRLSEDDEDAMWLLSDRVTGERTGFVSLRVSEESVNRFNNRVRQILMSSGSTTFAKIVKRWNTALTALATYFREAAAATPKLLEAIVKNEMRVQNKIKMGLNSKMPARFPPCVFYSPEELGGLGMLSASHILIPSSDLHGRTTTFKHGMDGSGSGEDVMVPNIFRYINSWDAEIADSRRVWSEYAQKRADALATDSRVTFEDLEDILDRGLPRISTIFQRDKTTLAFDKGFRARQFFKNFSNDRFDPFWWLNTRHDGRLWNFTSYRSDVVEALGGIGSILEHSLFKATGFEDWEGLFWQKQSGFEQQMQLQKLTNAQRSGLSQIPNRRFTLWWSPTINRANVYVGFLVQLDLTGIFLHGKIPTLKISYIQIFRAHLWQKIHESLVVDICQVLDREQSLLALDGIEKLPLHPRKSYRMNASTADILLTSSLGGGTGWPISKPSLLSDENDEFDYTWSDRFWIDIQLRYGDYDSHNISKYTRAKFLDYSSDGVSLYPSKTGLMICIDLAYNSCEAYGYWFPGLKQLIKRAMAKLMQSNPALYIFRERIRKALQLYQSDSRQTILKAENYGELLDRKTVIIDDTSVYRVTMHKTTNGNMTSKPINGALFAFDPLSGKLDVCIIHESLWAGQKKRSALSKWKAAEESAVLLRSYDPEQLPQQVIINSRGLKDPMEVNMLEFPGVTVRNTEFALPFSALIQLSSFTYLIDQAGAPLPGIQDRHTFNLYDDWLKLSQPNTAFSRMMLLLRGLHVDPEPVKRILRQKAAGSEHIEGFIWPKLDPGDWIEVENAVSDIIIEEYSKANGVSRQSLTQSEIRDIILGQAIATPVEEKQRASFNSPSEAGADQAVVALTTKSHNVHGDEITVVTTSRYEQQAFESRATWRSRALDAASLLHYASLNIEISPVPASIDTPQINIPSNLIQDFVAASDVRNLAIALVYGRRQDASKSFDIISLVIPPQLGSSTNVSFSPTPDPSEDLPEGGDMQFLGVLRSQTRPRTDKGISPIDLSLLESRQRNEGWVSNKLLVLTLNYHPGSVDVQAFLPTEKGLDWGGANRDFLTETPYGYDSARFSQPASVVISKDEGFFYVPQNEVWNFSFSSAMWNAQHRAFLKVGQPIPYYDPMHRPIHFENVRKLGDVIEFEDQIF